MRRLLSLIFVLCLMGATRSARAQDCITDPPQYFGHNVVCVSASSETGVLTNETSEQVQFSPVAGNQVVVFGYLCTTATCTGQDSGARLLVGDNMRTSEPCFQASPSSPAPIQNNQTYLNWVWYCPNIPSGVTNITLTCTVANGCSYISIFAEQFTGLCASAPCFDGDGYASGVGTFQVASTSSGTYSNDYITAILGTEYDEALTPQAGCVQVDQLWVGNLIEGKVDSDPGVHRCAGSWSGTDVWGILVAAIRSAQSAQAYTVLHSFNQNDGSFPVGPLVQDSLGNLYGVASLGGRYDAGTVFKIIPPGIVCCAPQLVTLHNFSGTNGDGAYPEAGLVQDSSGNLYGTTTQGGAAGYGTVYKLTPQGQMTILYSFAGGTDGAYPWAPLLLDLEGNIYGTTYAGGDLKCLLLAPDLGCGTLFQITPNGKHSYSFTGANGDGAGVQYAGLVTDGARNLYGVTAFGGDLACNPEGCGTIFGLSKTWVETPLYEFTGNGGDGANPYGTLLVGSNALYGSTRYGGDLTCNRPSGCGTLFKLGKSGEQAYGFPAGASDGGEPLAGLVRDAQGNYYGTTNLGGNMQCNQPQGCGTIFKVSGNRSQTILHNFAGGSADGIGPLGNLFQGGDGNLYGTTVYGGGTGCGGTGCGIVFKLVP